MGGARERLGNLVVAGCLAGGLVIGAAGPGGAGDVVLDLAISRSLNGFYEGDGVYDAGDGQTLMKVAAPGAKRTFHWQVDNDGTIQGGTVTGNPGDGCFKVKYIGPDDDDITEEVVAGVPGQEPGSQSEPGLRVEVKARRCAAPGDSFVAKIDASPTGDGEVRDRIKAKLKVG